VINESTLSSARSASFGMSGSGSIPQPRLEKAAHEFEAQMMKELMAPLASTKGLPGESEDDAGSDSALSSFAGEALSKAISELGGFGIAKSILHRLANGSNSVSGSEPNHSGKSGDAFYPIRNSAKASSK